MDLLYGMLHGLGPRLFERNGICPLMMVDKQYGECDDQIKVVDITDLRRQDANQLHVVWWMVWLVGYSSPAAAASPHLQPSAATD